MEVDGTANISEIDKGVRNKWNWQWLEEKDADGHFLSEYIRKVDRPGYAKCIICKCELQYGKGGKKDVVGHASKKKHQRNRKLRETQTTLPSIFQKTKAMESGAMTSSSTSSSSSHGSASTSSSSGCSGLPYGVASNVHDPAKCSGKVTDESAPKVSYSDRKSIAEAKIVTFIAEHSLPFTMAPHLIALSQSDSMYCP